MNEPVNPEKTPGPEHRRRFRRIPPSRCRNRSFRRLLQLGASWFGILPKLLAFSGRGCFVGFGCMDRRNSAGDIPWVPLLYYRLLPIVIASGLKAIFLTD